MSIRVLRLLRLLPIVAYAAISAATPGCARTAPRSVFAGDRIEAEAGATTARVNAAEILSRGEAPHDSALVTDGESSMASNSPGTQNKLWFQRGDFDGWAFLPKDFTLRGLDWNQTAEGTRVRVEQVSSLASPVIDAETGYVREGRQLAAALSADQRAALEKFYAEAGETARAAAPGMFAVIKAALGVP